MAMSFRWSIMRMSALVGMLGIAGVLGGCASSGRVSEADTLALYRAHAGEPVPSFRAMTAITGWTPLADNVLAVWTRPSEAWLLDLDGACTGLRHAHSIDVTRNIGQVSARFDKVIVQGSGMDRRIPCTILSIRPLDTGALKQSQHELREVRASQAASSGT